MSRTAAHFQTASSSRYAPRYVLQRRVRRRNTSIEDVLVKGGHPLSASDRALDEDFIVALIDVILVAQDLMKPSELAFDLGGHLGGS